jgi:nucleoside-diphosphate-sugar epimerase
VCSLERPFWFSRAFRRATGEMIEGKGKAMVPGRGDLPVSFITIEDVAGLMVNAVDHPEAGKGRVPYEMP